MIRKKKFAAKILNLKHETFMIYAVALNINLNNKIDSLKKAQIAHLKVDKALVKISSKYADFVDVFLPKLVTEPCEYRKINNCAIKIIDDR